MSVHQMRAILTVFLFLVLAAGSRAEAYKLQDHSQLILVTPAGWNQSHGDLGDLIFRFAPKNPKLNALGELTVSAGVATFPEDAAADEELIEAADVRLYESKRSGRNRVSGKPSD